MRNLLIFRWRYFVWTIIILITEVLIAAFLNDGFVRPYFGDFLVVILLYCFVRSFFRSGVISTAIGVLLFAYFIELTQYLHLIDHLGLRHSNITRALIGGSFDMFDLLAYTLGAVLILFCEKGVR